MVTHALYAGKLGHARHLPKYHGFHYHIFMFYLDLENLDTLSQQFKRVAIEKFAWFSFQRRHYLFPSAGSLQDGLRCYVQEKKGVLPEGKIYFLTQLSCLGYCFNPISLYFIFHKDSDQLQYTIAEVTNTPWGERHWYILETGLQPKPDIYQYRFQKQLHVSPFMTMDYDYQLNLKLSADQIIVHMKSFRQGRYHFDATLSLKKIPETREAEAMLRQHPLMTYKITLAIYWQALKLWLKGFTFYSRPPHSNRKD